jgi:hypothetical protein
MWNYRCKYKTRDSRVLAVATIVLDLGYTIRQNNATRTLTNYRVSAGHGQFIALAPPREF